MPDSASGVSKTRCFAVFGLQPVGDAEDAAEPAAVLAEDQRLGVLRQDLVEGAVQRLLHGQLFGACCRAPPDRVLRVR